MTPDLRQLRYFMAVADELNFTRAAARLHMETLIVASGLESAGYTATVVELCRAAGFEPRTIPEPYSGLLEGKRDWLRWAGIDDVSEVRFQPTLVTADADRARQAAQAEARELAERFAGVPILTR